MRPADSLAGVPDVVTWYDDPLVPAVGALRDGDCVASLEMDIGSLAVCREAACTHWGEQTEPSGLDLVVELRSADIDVLAVTPTRRRTRRPMY